MSDAASSSNSAATAVPASTSASTKTKAKTPVEWSCTCLNVQLTGSAEKGVEEMSKHKGLVHVHLDENGERSQRGAYLTYEPDESGRPTRIGEAMGEPTGDVWRVCALCSSKVYKTSGRKRGDAAVSGDWVEVDLRGVLSGQALVAAREADTLPFSHLRLTIPDSSNFGRPPTNNLSGSALYPSQSPSQAPRPPSHLLPKLADPFFLPPPFTPAHPHLQELCAEAVTYLAERNDAAENQVREFIEAKSREMRLLQEKVRAEVEVMWESFAAGPGREERERSRSASISRSVDRRALRSRPSLSRKSRASPISSSPPAQPSDNPILREAAVQSNGASLLSASISQNAYVPPPRLDSATDNGIDALSRTRPTRGDERAIAMSYMINGADEMERLKAAADTQRARHGHQRTTGRSVVDRDVEDVQDQLAQHGEEHDIHGKDSWIDEERNLAARFKPTQATVPEGDATPRRGSAEGKGKERARVKFEEPKKDEQDEVKEANGDEEDVFDFELEDAKPVGKAEGKPRDLYEENIASALAGGIPSHRAAYRRMRESGRDLYEFIRRRPTSSTSSLDETNISALATSMPMHIASPFMHRPSGLHPLERKTSLSERQGLLVPPLKKAMRGGVDADTDLGIGLGPAPSSSDATPRQGGAPAPAHSGEMRRSSRSASVSREREREMTMSFHQDPGAVFEALGDGAEDDADEAGDEPGTLRERAFMPPHLIARQEDLQSGDVGWRSMVTD